MTSAAVAATIMVVTMIMMIASDIGIKHQLTGKQSLHSLIRITGNAAEQLDPCLLQRHLRATADAAANEYIDALGLQKACQRTVTGAVGIHDLRGLNSIALDLVYLKLRGVTKMLED